MFLNIMNQKENRTCEHCQKNFTITEGEFDALAAFQMLGSRYPTVSIRRGATGAVKDVTEAFSWLDTFDNVVIAFDNDKPGQEASKLVAELFAHKALVVKLTKYKDANEALMRLRSGRLRGAAGPQWRDHPGRAGAS